MDTEPAHIYPDCPTVVRDVRVSGLTKATLLQELRDHGIQMNQSGEALFADERFTTSEIGYSVDTVELTVRDLGYPDGATIDDIYAKARSVGLDVCPLELGPYFRLQYLDQPEGFVGQPVRQHRAPSGSITVASEPLVDDDDFPKGFYVRRIEGVLWLRGYHSGLAHVWDADDHFMFRRR